MVKMMALGRSCHDGDRFDIDCVVCYVYIVSLLVVR